jgi:hypothetical protein
MRSTFLTLTTPVMVPLTAAPAVTGGRLPRIVELASARPLRAAYWPTRAAGLGTSSLPSFPYHTVV